MDIRVISFHDNEVQIRYNHKGMNAMTGMVKIIISKQFLVSSSTARYIQSIGRMLH